MARRTTRKRPRPKPVAPIGWSHPKWFGRDATPGRQTSARKARNEEGQRM